MKLNIEENLVNNNEVIMISDNIISYPERKKANKRGVLSKAFHFLGYKGIITLIIIGIVFIFGLQNIESTSVQFLFWKILEVSKLNLILISISLGIILGFLLGLRFNRSSRP